jgi:AcrR family transcriptional regulator
MQKQRTRMSAEVRRGIILDAATALIAERGYNGFTLANLAEACAMTNAGLLHYFASKDELLLAVLDYQDGANEAFLADLDYDTTTKDGARRFLDELVERSVGLKEITRLYVVLGAEALDVHHPAHEHMSDRARAVRRRSIELASAWHPAPALFVAMVMAFTDGLQFDWLRDESVDVMTTWRHFADLVFA